MAGLVDIMYPAVTATYILEGDKSTGFECLTYLELLSQHFSALDTRGHTDDEIAQAASDLCPTLKKMAMHVVQDHAPSEQLDLIDEIMVRTVKTFQPAADYFLTKIWNIGGQPETTHTFHRTMQVIRALSLFSPNRIVSKHRDDRFRTVCGLLDGIDLAKFSANDILSRLEDEWEMYKSECFRFVQLNEENPGDGRVSHELFEQFWDELKSSNKCSAWVAAERIAVTYTVTSAAAERVFSLLRLVLTARRLSLLRDYIETSLMVMYNERDKTGRHGIPLV